jgi:hypothetical protein
VIRTSRDEPFGIVIHICMETTQEISLYSYIYLKLAKHHDSLITFYDSSSTKSENRGWNRFCLEVGEVCNGGKG